MKQISSLELHFLVREFECLIGSRIDNIYNAGKDILIFQFHKSNVGKIMLKIIIGKAICISVNKENDEKPSNFCQLLRKHLDGKFLTSIRQIEPERILELVFESKNEKIKVYAEFFNPGNIVVCNSEDIIIGALNIQKFKDRNVVPKEKYSYPKSKQNFFEISEAGLAEVFKNSQKDRLVTSLAIELGLGGVYSEEACLMANADKSINPKDINPKDIKNIQQNIKKILNKKITSEVIFLNDKIIDAVPFDLLFYKNFSKQSFEKFSAALDFYYSNIVEGKKSAYAVKIEGLRRIIENQTIAIGQLNQEEKEYREKGEMIYHKYQTVNEILTEISKAAQKYSWQEIKEKLKGYKVIKEINLKDKTIAIEV